MQDYFNDIYGGKVKVGDFSGSRLFVLGHHYKELTEGSGLFSSTVARAGVFSVTDPVVKAFILARGGKANTASHLSTIERMKNDGSPMLCFPNPLLPDEVHSKVDGARYFAAFGSCKPPLIWAPQATVTDFNRAWLIGKYGDKVVADMEKNLARLREYEKQSLIKMFNSKLKASGLADDISAELAKHIWSCSGFSKDPMTDKSIPVEITEGQKKIYCMAQGRESMMLDQITKEIEGLDTNITNVGELKKQISNVKYIEPALFVCMPGVWLVASKNPNNDPDVKYVLNESWKNIVDFTDRSVNFTFDADATYNLEVANAGNWTGFAMKREFPGCEIRYRLYDKEKKIYDKVTGDPIKIGADDFIRGFGPDAFFAMPAVKIATGVPRKTIKDLAETNKTGYIEALQLLGKESVANTPKPSDEQEMLKFS